MTSYDHMRSQSAWVSDRSADWLDLYRTLPLLGAAPLLRTIDASFSVPGLNSLQSMTVPLWLLE